MEFRNMVMITLYARQQKRHRCLEQTFGLRGRRADQGKSDARRGAPEAGALWRVQGQGGEGAGRGVTNEGDMCTCDRFMQIHGENHHNIVN